MTMNLDVNKGFLLQHADVKIECPCCGKEMMGLLANEEYEPKAGEISLCSYCTSYLITIKDGLHFRELTVDEVCDLPNEVLYQLTKARSMLKQLKDF
jgi:Zn finger protein HypA/HybF involved in hydrogenase expression